MGLRFVRHPPEYSANRRVSCSDRVEGEPITLRLAYVPAHDEPDHGLRIEAFQLVDRLCVNITHGLSFHMAR